MRVTSVNTWTNTMDIYHDVIAVKFLQVEGKVKLTGEGGRTISLEMENIVRIEE